MRILMWEHFAPGGPIRVGGHHLAERFLRRGALVAWLAGPVSPANFVRTNPETRARMRLWRRGGERLAAGRMFAYAPMTLLPHRRYPLLDGAFAARRTLGFSVPPWRRVLARAGFERVDLLWMSPGSPFLALLDGLPHDRAVYRMSDDTGAFPDAPRSHDRLETEALRRVDLVVATARRLAASARERGARRVLYLPNACDPGPFLAPGLREPADVAALPRPRAVYAGSLDSWFDTGLLASVASLLPRWTFVLIGPTRAARRPLAARSNVVLLGPRPYADLPAYFRFADAGIVPFVLTPLTHAIHPIKIYEYLAAGLPVVATPMEESAAIGAPIRLAADPEAFAAALEAARQEGTGAAEARRAFARRHTWDDRFATLLRALEDGAGPRRRAAGGAA
jgi:glycosyltransferase involved in cell wall biosynthesis